MSSKIEKIIVRLQAKTAEGQYYEAQQQTRVVAARYIKQQDWPAAIDILYNVAQSLLKAGQGGSGGDLALFMLDVYKQAELAPDAANKSKVLTLLRQFKSDEPTRKQFITEMIAWSSKCGSYPAGEPELHHVAGALYAEEFEAYDAERHLILGTKDSPAVLTKMEYIWYTQDDSHTAATYAARAVLPYLLMGNVRDAAQSLNHFTTALTSSNQSLALEMVVSGQLEALIFPSLPLLNFLSLLVAVVQKGNVDLFKQLSNKYAAHLREVEAWGEAMVTIGELYFNIQRPRQGNPLFDMMGSMFGGGGAPAKPPPRRIGASIPPPEGLD